MLIFNRTKGVPTKHSFLFWLGMFGAMFLTMFLALPAMAAEPIARGFGPPQDQLIPVQGPRQVFRNDLTVERGQVIEDDVFVYSGNVSMKDGSRITGDLVVFSGDVEIGEDAVVEGDVISYSGNLDVAGRVSGDLTAMSGNIDLRSTSVVNGDISIVSGRINRDELASVGGNVVQGPSFRFPSPRSTDEPRGSGANFESRGGSLVSSFVHLILRLVSAVVITAIVVLLVGGLFYLRPQLVVDTRKQLHEHLALSAVVGGLANLVVLFLIGLLAVTLCLLPLALIPLLAILAVNIIGWAVASQIAGERIVKFAKQEVSPALTILVGALFLTGAVALLWALGGCFKFVASLLIFAVASLGAGAVLVPWLNRRGGGGNSGGGGDVPPVSPAPDAPGGGSTSSYATPHYDVPDYDMPTQSADASRGGASESVSAVVEHDLAAPIDYVTAQEVITTDIVTGDAVGEDDDFLKLKGIGPTYARRLKDAGYRSFAQLAAASPEEVAAAIGWPVDRVRRAEVIDQAKVLAQQ